MALPMIAYLLACLVAAFVLTIVVSLFRKVERLDDFKSWRYTMTFFPILVLAPYGYAEVMTRVHGDDMQDAVTDLMDDAGIYGDLAYYKVRHADEEKATIVAVALEESKWGDKERTVFTADLSHGKRGWEADEYEIVNSFMRQKDSSTFPPFW